jgi:hypothetical protein
MASLRTGSTFDILARGPGILPGRRLDGIVIKAVSGKQVIDLLIFSINQKPTDN